MNALAEKMSSFITASGFSGVVRVERGGAQLVCGAYGLAHRGFEIPNTIDTQFAVASGGKGFTALAVVSLIVDGILELDTPARALLGADLPLVDDAVTVEHLLAHRSGIGDYLDEEDDDADPTDYVLKSPVQVLANTEAFLAEVDGHPTKFPPGERFSYSNGGYVVLALIAERASGKAYHDLVAERVLVPAGLSDTGFLRSDEPSGRMALGYIHGTGLQTNIFHLPVRGNGDGGIYTTAADMHTLWDSFLAGRIVPAEWVTEMTRAHSTGVSEGANYGLGFWLASDGHAVRLVGADAGVSFYSEHDPTRPSTWTVLSNSTEGAWPVVHYLQDLMGS